MKNNYRNPLFRQLRDKLLTTAPPEQRFERTRRAEDLLVGLDPAKRYPYEYFYLRIVGEQPILQPNPNVTVEDASTTFAVW